MRRLVQECTSSAPSFVLLRLTHDRNSVEISTPTIDAVFRVTLVLNLRIEHFFPRSDVETSTAVDRICWVVGGVNQRGVLCGGMASNSVHCDLSR